MSEARTTIALSADAGVVAQIVKDKFGLAELMDAARLGASVAIARGISPVGRRDAAPTGGTWNLGSIDRDGELRALVKALHPEVDEDPGLMLETLVNRGLEVLGDLVQQEDDATITALIASVNAASSEPS